jgi:hypothetical protein
MKQPNTAGELRDFLLKSLTELKSGDLKLDDAKQIAAISRNIVKSAIAQVNYYELRQEKPVIDFLSDDRL